ncbi:54S ribosomal protein yml6, mitochondrial [Ciborinia camelliae]|nr:54S ribosomal protein yml6, mitochondrial [Ciborinia camelliae]
MATKGLQSFTRSLNAFRTSINSARDPLAQCLAPQFTRSMATEAPLPSSISQEYEPNILTQTSDTISNPFDSPVLTTIYKFPTMEPVRFESYSSKHLYLPLRRDLLHRAVVFEGDNTRQGTASSKTRWDVHGSHRKIRPQKGTGGARLGWRQSPLIVGGGKSFGPHPRDFGTDLPKKMYDIAWRTALSWRYRRGQLIVCEDGMHFERREQKHAESIFEALGWKNHKKEKNRTLIVTLDSGANLGSIVREKDARVLDVSDVDVKDLLELSRVVIEKSALDRMLEEHQSDLVKKVRSAA